MTRQPKITIILLLMALLSAAKMGAADFQRVFSTINAANGLADNSAQVVVCTKTGRMIIGTIGNINFYDGAGFTHIDTKQEYQYILQNYRGNYHLYFDTKHHLWLKNTQSVTCVNLTTERFVEDVDEVFRQLGYDGKVNDLFVDTLGQVWVLHQEGLFCTDTQKTFQVLRDHNLQDLEIFGNMVLLFYENGEEVGLSLDDGHIMHRTKAYDWDRAQQYNASSLLQRYEDGFFQLRNGQKESILMYFNVKSGEWKELLALPYHLNSMAIHEDILYIASEYGYWTYDPKTSATHHEERLTQVNGMPLLTDVNTLAFDKQGGMWIGTEKRGLLYARPMVSPFHALTWDNPQALHYATMMDGLEQNITEFQGKAANCMYTDSRGWTWFGTTMGLYMFRTPKSEPVVFTKKEGLLNNVIHSVIEDQRHNIWVATSCGISYIMFEGDQPIFVNSFNEADNVPNESFSNCKAICLDDGNIVMQALDHVVKFHPDSFGMMNDRKPFKLYPKLVKILVNGNVAQPNVEENGNVIIDRATTRVRDISLNADQNSLTLTFSGLNYFRPLQTYYKVHVTRYYEEWELFSYFSTDLVDSKGMLHLPLIGLKPGEYEVEVQASMFPDVWTGEPYKWVIHVNEPWWRTTGMLMVMGLLLASLIVVNFFIYNRNTRMRMQRNNEEGDVIRRIVAFVERVDALEHETLAPRLEEVNGSYIDQQAELPPSFIEMMRKLVPFVRDNKNHDLSMQQLSQAGQVDIVELYETVTGNLYKSPLALARINRLEKAAQLLKSTDKSIEAIADECGFYTPNYFIGNFFHEYKMTPLEYREENAEV